MQTEKKLKILYVITKGNWGGAQRYVFDLATHETNNQFEIVVLIGEGTELKTRLTEKKIRVIPFSFMNRDISFWNDFITLGRLFRLFTREQPDIVHLNSSKAGGLGGLAARLSNLSSFLLYRINAIRYPIKTIRIIFTAHGLPMDENRPIGQRLAILAVSYFTVLLSHHTICVSKKDAARVSCWPFVQTKGAVIPLGITAPPFLSRSEARAILERAIHKPSGFLSDKLIIGTIAELTTNKGLPYAILALKELPQAQYIIIGDGEKQNKILDDIRTEGLADRIFLAGQIPNAARLLKAFTIFLLPSLKEGLPYALLEAGLARLPVIASAVGGIPDLITAQTGILVNPKQPKEITIALSALLMDKKRQTDLGANLERRITKQHSLNEMITKTHALYHINEARGVAESPLQ